MEFLYYLPIFVHFAHIFGGFFPFSRLLVFEGKPIPFVEEARGHPLSLWGGTERVYRVMLRERGDRNIPISEVRNFILGILRYATSRYALVPPLEYNRSSGGAE